MIFSPTDRGPVVERPAPVRVPAERIVRHPLDMPARAKCSRHQTWHDGCHACTIAQGVRMDVYAHDLRQHVANKIARIDRFGR